MFVLCWVYGCIGMCLQTQTTMVVWQRRRRRRRRQRWRRWNRTRGRKISTNVCRKHFVTEAFFWLSKMTDLVRKCASNRTTEVDFAILVYILLKVMCGTNFEHGIPLHTYPSIYPSIHACMHVCSCIYVEIWRDSASEKMNLIFCVTIIMTLLSSTSPLCSTIIML